MALSIENVSIAKHGEYNCSARNIHGVSTIGFRLNVLCKFLFKMGKNRRFHINTVRRCTAADRRHKPNHRRISKGFHSFELFSERCESSTNF